MDVPSVSAGCLAARKKKKRKRADNIRRGVTASVVSVSVQLVMEDANEGRACGARKHLSHLSIVDLCDFLKVVVKKTVFWCTNSKSVHSESCSANPVWDRKSSLRSDKCAPWSSRVQV